ncbi:acyl-CoA dehydrogenase family protein [Nocardia otitidiscaviarum]|uniref:acyl-CoA dehydrogenase family protein n=1 Tax=Nocardia otitidiscaviarum TaxID=1823 RepID=UPI001894426A|nr:acyl-CoA dehydrogenase family protein [Nocardia otitidiscaviarum]MBF6236203.1 acyl-CoA dehydrogenase family protein [Nocardia otitidiscaviarum]
MTIATTDEHKAVQESMRGWAAAMRPIATMRTGAPDYWREYWSRLADLGIFRVAVPEATGGAGGTVGDLAVLVEQAAHDLVGGPVLSTALAGLVAGETLDENTPCGVALGGEIEISAGETDLTLTGEWDVVIGAAPGAAVLVPVRTGDRGRWCLLDADAAGLRVEPLEPLDHSTPLARVVCSNVTVAPEKIFSPRENVLDLAAVLVAAEAAGIAGWCLETATEYAKVREQFGKKIGEFQAVKHICAWMLCRAEQIRAVAADAADAVDTGSSELPLAAAIALAVSLDAAVETAKDCIQVLGGIGFTWEHDAHLYLRRAVALRQLLGGSARWRARVAELTLQGQRRTVGLDLGADAAVAGEPNWEAVGLDAEQAAVLAAELSGIAALPAAEQRNALADTGLLASHWPRPYGRGAGPILRSLIEEQIRKAGIELPDIAIANWAVPTLLQYGTPEQIERFAGPTLRGEVVWCQLFSEPEAGSDLAALRTVARRVDGGWKLRGQKVWTSLAKEATWGICLARTDPAAPKHKGISYFLVEMNSPGLEIRPLVQITGEAKFSEVFLDDVFVPDECLVGQLGNGWKIARSTLSAERVAMGGKGIGEELEALIAAAPTSGPGAELVADRLGGLVSESVAGTLLEARAARKLLSGGDPGPESSVRKLVGVRHRQAVAEFAVELSGVPGALESDVVKEFLLTRCLSIAGGTEQILLTVAGERILGLPRESQ